ncbi:MAG: ferrous iron transport protein B [Planctomycetia bacterium]|nr:ferrous iron transport protein B [Planctomycetia bacterium]
MIATRTTTVALVGNPNTGKTTLFNALSGLRQRVGNYPGVTVETKKGRMTWKDQGFDLIDLPGTYSLAPRSPDEMVAVDLILGHQAGEPRPDVLVSIVDAANLERNLYLTTQALEMGIPVVVALNMIDVAQAQGILVDADKLGKQLGVTVVPIQANKRRGLDELKQAVAACAGRAAPNGAVAPAFPDAFEQEVSALQKSLGEEVEPFVARRLLLDVGGYIETKLEAKHPDLKQRVEDARQRLQQAGAGVPGVEARVRYGWIRQNTAGCIQRPAQRVVTWTDRIDRVLTHRVFGTIIFLALMLLVFWSIFKWATPAMDLINEAKDALGGWINDALPAGPLTSLLADGVVKGVGGVVVFLPQILILFGFIAVLEDCGYMARAAFLMDRLMARCGLSGKSFIPMLSSMACAIPGIMAARVIENQRDRFTTILVAPLMSCSARLPVYLLLIAAFLPASVYGEWTPVLTMFAMYLIGLIVAPLIALLLKRTLLRGETPVFVMEMPLYKRPSLRTVLRRMFDAGWAFVYRAGTLILASMIVVWALLYFPNTDANGVKYDDRIAALNEPHEEARKELKALKVSIAKESEELEKLNTAAQHAGEAGLPAADEARREELEAAVKPVEEKMEPLQARLKPIDEAINKIKGEWKANSLLGQLGHIIEPVVAPLGWDWRIGTAALASFPAREVIVGTLGIIYDLGEEAEESDLATALQEAKWESGPKAGQPVFSIPVALSIMVFFALCAQCASTLAVIKRETRSWGWAAFTFGYMTALAYIGALLVYQIGSRIV